LKKSELMLFVLGCYFIALLSTMASLSALLGNDLTGKSGSVATETLTGDGKVIGLYFSAHWCPPCRAFTPQLAEFYKKIKDGPNGSNFEIVFVSSDRDDASFTEYFNEMPWLALPFSDRDRKVCINNYNLLNGVFICSFIEQGFQEVQNPRHSNLGLA
jgi:nucleoredoxin